MLHTLKNRIPRSCTLWDISHTADVLGCSARAKINSPFESLKMFKNWKARADGWALSCSTEINEFESIWHLTWWVSSAPATKSWLVQNRRTLNTVLEEHRGKCELSWKRSKSLPCQPQWIFLSLISFPFPPPWPQGGKKKKGKNKKNQF